MSHFEKLESYLPIDLTSPVNFIVATGVVFFIIVLRYFLVAGAFYGIFWWRPSRRLKQKALYPLNGKVAQMRMEIRWSIVASFIFALAGVLAGLAWQTGYTKIYLRFDEYPFWYLPASLILYSWVHEIYFYVTHRWMHRPSIFKHVHYVHHLSREPSPWASFSFHPLESIVEALILPLMVLFIPIHPVVFITYLTLMTISAVNNHLGYELLPDWARRWGAEKILISGRHHALHHKLYSCHFGLYYSVLDRWLKTEPKSGTGSSY